MPCGASVFRQFLFDATFECVPLRAPRTHVSFHQKDQAFQIVSQTEAPEGPLCLSVNGGKVGTVGAEVSLQSCSEASRIGDGRDIFAMHRNGQLYTVMGRKCVARGDERETDKGSELPLELADCDNVGPKTIAWRPLERKQKLRHAGQLPSRQPRGQGGNSADEVTPYYLMAAPFLIGSKTNSKSDFARSQIEKAATSPQHGLCLSMRGPKEGDGDIAHKATVAADSTSDTIAHGPERVVDGKDFTFWSSLPDPDSPVTLEVSLDESHLLKKVDIHWECRAPNFSLETKTADGSSGGWEEQFATWWEDPKLSRKKTIAGVKGSATAESARGEDMHTVVTLDGVRSSALRIVMHQPVPQCYGIKSFGIHEVSLNASKLHPVLEPCADVAKVTEQRGKWFLGDVGQLNPCITTMDAHKKMPLVPFSTPGATAGAGAAGLSVIHRTREALAVASGVTAFLAIVSAISRCAKTAVSTEASGDGRQPQDERANESRMSTGSRSKLLFPDRGV